MTVHATAFRKGAFGYASLLLAALILLPNTTLSADSKKQIVAYYFHTSIRCRTCLLIEERAEDILRYEFADLFKSGDMQWRAVNVQLPGNRRFLEDLYVNPKSLVLVEYLDGAPRKRTILPKVWQFVHDDDPAVFDKYVADTTHRFLEEDAPPP